MYCLLPAHRTELNVLQKVHHPHCVQFVGAVTRSSPYMIITEFMACGSLADIFKRQEYPGLRRAAQLALDCARGIAYLHNHAPMSIIHRWVLCCVIVSPSQGGTCYVQPTPADL